MSHQKLPLTAALMACGCTAAFRLGVEGSPITVVITRKGSGCQVPFHVADIPVFDHREALRPSTRHPLLPQPDYEEES
jgi:hypothetical protein